MRNNPLSRSYCLIRNMNTPSQFSPFYQKLSTHRLSLNRVLYMLTSVWVLHTPMLVDLYFFHIFLTKKRKKGRKSKTIEAKFCKITRFFSLHPYSGWEMLKSVPLSHAFCYCYKLIQLVMVTGLLIYMVQLQVLYT